MCCNQETGRGGHASLPSGRRTGHSAHPCPGAESECHPRLQPERCGTEDRRCIPRMTRAAPVEGAVGCRIQGTDIRSAAATFRFLLRLPQLLGRQLSRCRKRVLPGCTATHSHEEGLETLRLNDRVERAANGFIRWAKPHSSQPQHILGAELPGRWPVRCEPEQVATMRARRIEGRLRGINLEIVAADRAAIGGPFRSPRRDSHAGLVLSDLCGHRRSRRWLPRELPSCNLRRVCRAVKRGPHPAPPVSTTPARGSRLSRREVAALSQGQVFPLLRRLRSAYDGRVPGYCHHLYLPSPERVCSRGSYAPPRQQAGRPDDRQPG
jgi:hypothetical protein